MNKIKLIAFDLDGTLTNHREIVPKENLELLSRLSKKYKLIMLGAGRVERIFTQMGNFPIDIIGNYGMQYAKYNKSTKNIEVVRNDTIPCNKELITQKISYFRNKYGFTSFAGESVEFHPSGCVTFPILGTKAIHEEKLSFDPTKEKRRKIYQEVAEAFSDFNVFVGGSSSFDMSPKPYNKYYALDIYCKENEISHDEVVFVGDDYGIGGNDESVYLSDFKFIKVDDYKKLPEILEFL
jgi:HAD superfamily hydrolase (TIGR01484 family)